MSAIGTIIVLWTAFANNYATKTDPIVSCGICQQLEIKLYLVESTCCGQLEGRFGCDFML
jgi:hypothetical protein